MRVSAKGAHVSTALVETNRKPPQPSCVMPVSSLWNHTEGRSGRGGVGACTADGKAPPSTATFGKGVAVRTALGNELT